MPPGFDSPADAAARLHGLLDGFAEAPFTLQRLCEVLCEPRKQYNRIDKVVSGERWGCAAETRHGVALQLATPSSLSEQRQSLLHRSSPCRQVAGIEKLLMVTSTRRPDPHDSLPPPPALSDLTRVNENPPSPYFDGRPPQVSKGGRRLC